MVNDTATPSILICYRRSEGVGQTGAAMTHFFPSKQSAVTCSFNRDYHVPGTVLGIGSRQEHSKDV